MKSPFTGGHARLQNERRTVEFRKEKFEIVFQFYVCEDTNETFTTDELDQVNTIQAYNRYRVMQGIPFPDEIREIREKYGLSAVKMSAILGFGVNMYGKYEQGEIPNVSNGRMIKSCNNPTVFQTYCEEARFQFTDKERDNIRKKIDKVLSEYDESERIVSQTIMKQALGNIGRSIFTGFTEPSLEKAKQMALFFAQHVRPYLTKFNKLLFYADFLNYKKTGFSISGMSYRAIPYGPVPQNYYGLVAAASDVIDKEVDDYGDKMVPNKGCEFDQTMFSAMETDTLHAVLQKFGNATAKSIVEISHQEPAWIENERQKSLISYEWAMDLFGI